MNTRHKKQPEEEWLRETETYQKILNFKGHYEENEKATHRTKDIFTNHTFDKGIGPEYIKHFYYLIIRRQPCLFVFLK